jgi:hypothetical protein
MIRFGPKHHNFGGVLKHGGNIIDVATHPVHQPALWY